MAARVGFVGALAALFVACASLNATCVNVDVNRHDQERYLSYAQMLAETHFNGIGNRIQMPALPTLLAFVWTPGITGDAFFVRAKIVCIILGLLSSLATWGVLRRILPTRSANALALVMAFYVVAFRAAYVHVEPLYFFASFVAFVAFCEAWRRPTVLKCLAAGAIAGAAWLCKGSIALVLYSFLGVVMARAVAFAVRGRFRSAMAGVFHAAAAVLGFATVVYPYARTSKQIYGSWLYNLATRYGVWADSNEELHALERRFGTYSENWHLIAPNPDIPSLGKYIRTHTLVDVVERMFTGFGLVVGNTLIGTGYALFAIAYGVMFVLLMRRLPPVRGAVFRRDPYALAYFVAPCFLVQILALSWVGMLGAGNRYSLPLFLPALAAAAYAMARHVPADQAITVRGRAVTVAAFERSVTHWALIGSVTAVPIAAALMYAGR